MGGTARASGRREAVPRCGRVPGRAYGGGAVGRWRNVRDARGYATYEEGRNLDSIVNTRRAMAASIQHAAVARVTGRVRMCVYTQG